VSPGDEVIYLPDPWLHGLMIVDFVLPNGRIVTISGPDEREAIFSPQELEPYAWWISKQETDPASLAPREAA
jgi:hypothetical protein